MFRLFRLLGLSKCRVFRVFGGSGGGMLLAGRSPVGVKMSDGPIIVGWLRLGDG